MACKQLVRQCFFVAYLEWILSGEMSKVFVLLLVVLIRSCSTLVCVVLLSAFRGRFDWPKLIRGMLSVRCSE